MSTATPVRHSFVFCARKVHTSPLIASFCSSGLIKSTTGLMIRLFGSNWTPSPVPNARATLKRTRAVCTWPAASAGTSSAGSVLETTGITRVRQAKVYATLGKMLSASAVLKMTKTSINLSKNWSVWLSTAKDTSSIKSPLGSLRRKWLRSKKP